MKCELTGTVYTKCIYTFHVTAEEEHFPLSQKRSLFLHICQNFGYGAIGNRGYKVYTAFRLYLYAENYFRIPPYVNFELALPLEVVDTKYVEYNMYNVLLSYQKHTFPDTPTSQKIIAKPTQKYYRDNLLKTGEI